MKGSLQDAYVIHSRPFKESSLLIDFFTREQGCITLVAKGAKRPRSPKRGLLQPFIPLNISWQGRGELGTLTHIEAYGLPVFLINRRLLSGLYLNELLYRLLQKNDPCIGLFDQYHQIIEKLAGVSCLQSILRVFERELLTALGYGLLLDKEQITGKAIIPEDLYLFDPLKGAIKITQEPDNFEPHQVVVRGEVLLALQEGIFPSRVVLKQSKSLMQRALGLQLGERALEVKKVVW